MKIAINKVKTDCRECSAMYELCCTGRHVFLVFDTVYERLTALSWSQQI